jgi:hypothetical protein
MPSASPSESPSESPTEIPKCVDSIIDFDTFPGNEEILPNTYVSNQWFEIYGLTLSSSGGFGVEPRIFDSSNPINDEDLGSPNEACDSGGPGVGEGGFPDNCEAQKNVLIIEESGGKYADDNEFGGSISFNFEDAVDISAIGLIDIDEDEAESSITAIFEDGTTSDPIAVLAKGDNSYQVIEINLSNVSILNVTFRGSGAIAFISFCSFPRV